MAITDTVKAGTLPRPGPIGRGVRLVIGLAVLSLLLNTLGNWEIFFEFRKGSELPDSLLIGMVLSFFFFGEVFRRGFGLESARPGQIVLLALALLAAAFDLIAYGDWWGPAFGGLVLFLMVYMLGHLGVSFIVAAAFATPG